MKLWQILLCVLLAAWVVVLFAFAPATHAPRPGPRALRPAEQVFVRNDTIFVLENGEIRFVPPSWTRCTPPKSKR